MVLEVIVDISTAEVDRPFDYEGEDVPLGSRVAVPFGPMRKVGFVVGKKENPIIRILNVPNISIPP